MRKLQYVERWPPDGTYYVRIVKISEVTLSERPYLRIDAEIISEDRRLMGIVVNTIAPALLAPGRPLARIYETVMRSELKDGMEPDIDEMIGREVFVSVKNMQGKNKKYYPRIAEFLRHAPPAASVRLEA